MRQWRHGGWCDSPKPVGLESEDHRSWPNSGFLHDPFSFMSVAVEKKEHFLSAHFSLSHHPTFPQYSGTIYSWYEGSHNTEPTIKLSLELPLLLSLSFLHAYLCRPLTMVLDLTEQFPVLPARELPCQALGTTPLPAPNPNQDGLWKKLGFDSQSPAHPHTTA